MKLNVIKSKPKDASAIIIYYKKKVLLNLRSNKKNIFYPNHWGLLGGAKENKENLRETAIREFEEETSVKIVKKKCGDIGGVKLHSQLGLRRPALVLWEGRPRRPSRERGPRTGPPKQLCAHGGWHTTVGPMLQRRN